MLLLALTACAGPRPGLPRPDPTVARMGAWTASDVDTWLAQHGHGPVGGHRSLLADGRWTAQDTRVTALRRWAEWWQGVLPEAELEERIDDLSVALEYEQDAP